MLSCGLPQIFSPGGRLAADPKVRGNNACKFKSESRGSPHPQLQGCCQKDLNLINLSVTPAHAPFLSLSRTLACVRDLLVLHRAHPTCQSLNSAAVCVSVRRLHSFRKCITFLKYSQTGIFECCYGDKCHEKLLPRKKK